MQTYVTNAVVIKKRDHKEVDRFYTLLTEEHGKITALGKATKKPSSKMAGHLEPGTVCRLMIANGRSFERIAGVTTRKKRPVMDVATLAQEWMFFELLDRLIQEGQKDPPLYDVAVDFLDTQYDAAHLLHFAFHAHRLFDKMGYALHLQTCAVCNMMFPREIVFSPFHGGMTCAACGRNDVDAFPVHIETIIVLRELHAHPWSVVAQLHPSADVQKEIESMTFSLIRSHTGRPLVTEVFMRM